MWDKTTIRNNKGEFLKLLMTHGQMSGTDAEQISQRLLFGAGDPSLVESESTVGFTPFAQQVNQRDLLFINGNNAADFAKFQSADLSGVMKTYILQAVHRKEYAEAFGNDGEDIQKALERAKEQGLTDKEVQEAGKVIMALEGTIGYNMNPQTRDLFASLVMFQNIALLPFSLFASLIDPIGIAVRSGDMREASVGYPEWVGYDLYRRDPAQCSPWVRLNADIIPRVPGVSHGGTFVDAPPATGTTWEYKLEPVDAAHNPVPLIGGTCDPPCAPHMWESIPKLAGPVTVATVGYDLGWAVILSPCTDACWYSFVVSNPEADLLRPHLGTGQFFRFYGDEFFGTFEGSYLYLDHFEPAGCGPTPARRASWGGFKLLYR